MKNWAIVISSGEAETIFNALRLASTALKHNNEVSVFMLGQAVDYEIISNLQFDLKSQVAEFQDRGDFYV